MVNGVVSLLEVHKAHVQWPFGQPRLIIGVAHGKEVSGSRLAGPEPSVCRDKQAVLFGPMHEACIQIDGVQPVQGHPHCNGPVVCWVENAAFFIFMHSFNFHAMPAHLVGRK